LEFAFLKACIREICERRARAVAALGEAAAFELERRLAEMEACENAAEFAELCGDELVVVSGVRWSLGLAEGIGMELIAGHVNPPLTETGVTDWSKVTRLRIEAIGGTHD
jgi:hypothetical protein